MPAPKSEMTALVDELARALFCSSCDPYGSWTSEREKASRFIAAAHAQGKAEGIVEENAGCAIIADEWAETAGDFAGKSADFCYGFWHAQEIIAKAIRSRLKQRIG